MTDNEIIKALKTLLELVLYEGRQQRAKTISLAVDLINRQKADIERLNKEVDRLSQCVLYHDGQIADAKAEAIKEFAERLKHKATETHNTIPRHYRYVISNDFIDNLVKEMAGDNNA